MFTTKDSMEKISILIPVYNREKYIKDCIYSILNQTYDNLQLIIYDDGSTDNTVNIIKDIKDPRIKLTLGKYHKGVCVARNILLKLCDTGIAAFQDSDDLSHILRIEEQFNVIKTTTNKIISTQHNRFPRNNYINLYTKNPFTLNEELIDNGNYIENSFGTMMFRVDKDTPEFDERVSWGGEDNLWIAMMHKKHSTYLIKKVLYYVRHHNDRITVHKRKPENKKLREYSLEIYHEEMSKLGLK